MKCLSHLLSDLILSTHIPRRKQAHETYVTVSPSFSHFMPSSSWHMLHLHPQTKVGIQYSYQNLFKWVWLLAALSKVTGIKRYTLEANSNFQLACLPWLLSYRQNLNLVSHSTLLTFFVLFNIQSSFMPSPQSSQYKFIMSDAHLMPWLLYQIIIHSGLECWT